MKRVIEIEEDRYDVLQQLEKAIHGTGYMNYFEETIANSTPLTKDATNGDVVEKIFGKDVYCALIRMMYSSCCEKLKNWWNAPYKAEGEDKE